MVNDHRASKISIINDAYRNDYYSPEDLATFININFQLMDTDRLQPEYKHEFLNLKAELLSKIDSRHIVNIKTSPLFGLFEISEEGENMKALIFALSSDGVDGNNNIHYETYYCRFKNYWMAGITSKM